MIFLIIRVVWYLFSNETLSSNMALDLRVRPGFLKGMSLK